MRVTIWILGDQLIFDHPALIWAKEHAAHADVRVLMIESRARTTQLPYQRKKLVLLFAAMRHYADALRARGYTIDYLHADSFSDALRDHMARARPDQIVTMAASEYRARAMQSALAHDTGIETIILPNSMFLVESFNPYPDPKPGKLYIMENFYREMRKHHRILLDNAGQPFGGAWNFDHDNRKPLPKSITPPVPLTFVPDAITQSVMEEIETTGHGVGTAHGFDLAVTHADAARALDDFIAHRLADFGAYEDAMSATHGTLFHSLLSPYVNIGLLTPMHMIDAAVTAYHDGRAPINSVEGFVRQIIGWREFIYWQYWRQMPDLRARNAWNATRAMPQMFWDGVTDMNCIRHVVTRLIETGYTHHIERLMIVCNFCLLAGIDPAQVADWFLIFYIDAYEWVVYPNVIGMGLNADGGQTATKPYIASANYIDKMSDYCDGCRFNPKQRTGADACPYNYLYWNFILEHEATLRANPRLGKNVLGLRYLDDDERAAVRDQARDFLTRLASYESGDKR
jgi:deoxyribodipyrimidine photolyase-related protein